MFVSIDVGTKTSGYQKVREWSKSRKDEYTLAQKKSTVLYEALSLLREMNPPGRVLQKKSVGEDEYWIELDDRKAIMKIRYYCFQNIHDIRGIPPQDSPTTVENDVRGNSNEVFPIDDSRTIDPNICIASKREDVSEMNAVSEREEVTKILNSMITVVDSIANDDKLSAHVDEEWLVEEKQVQKLLKEAFKVANITDDFARWKTLQEHSDQIKASFICDETFRVWWNDFDSRTCRLPKGSIKVMTSFCRQQRMGSYYTKDVAVLASPGKLGIVLDTVAEGVVVGRLRMSSVMANQVCPGDRIVAIDDEDVSHMSTQEIASIMARKNDDDKVLVIKPSLASTVEFTNSQAQVIPPSFQSNIEMLIFTYIKTYITSNRLRYNEVRVLLQLPPYFFCEEVGGKLCELREEFGSNFDGAWSSVIPKVANWWALIVDSKRHQSFDVSTLVKASAPIVSGSTTSSPLESTGLSKIQEICDCVKAYITTNEMQYNDVLDLLHLPPSSMLERSGRKIRELHKELGSNKFGIALSRAKKHVLYWFMSTSVSTSPSILDEIDQNVSTQQNLEAIVGGNVVRVKVTQDLSLECKAALNRSKRNGPANDDEHKIAQVIAKAASLPTCENNQKACLNAIRKYIVNKELTALTLRLGGLNMLANAMKSHSDRSNIQAEALLILSQIVWSHPATSRLMVNEGGCLQLAINVMERHVTHSKTQQMACDLFVALSYNKECCQAMLQSNVISSVLKSIKRRLKSIASEPVARVLAKGFLFLQNMAAISLDTVAKAIFREGNILSTLLQIIQTKASNAKSSDLLISSFGLLSNLAPHIDGNNRIADAGGAEIIQDKLASIKSAQLLKVALTTLLNLSLNGAVVQTLAENGCAYAVISVARASRDNPDLLLISLGLLDKLIDTEVAANQNAVASGAEAIALAAIGGHSSNNELRSVAISVLQKVSE
jgi:hypothetical protein